MKPSFFSPHCNLTLPTRIQIRDRLSFNTQPPLPRPSRLHAKNPSFGDDLPTDLTTLESVSKELMSCLQSDLADLKRLKTATEIREKKLQMIENFEQVSMILERIKTEIESDLHPTQNECQELEFQLKEMEQMILSMKRNVWNTETEKITQKSNKKESETSLNLDDLECLTNEEKAELNWLLSEFLATMEEDKDGGIYLMYFLKKFQSIKDQKPPSAKLQFDQLETGPILELVNEYSTRFQPIRKQPPSPPPKVSKSIKKMEESEDLVLVGGGGGGDDDDDDDVGDGGDESEDDENSNFRPLWFLMIIPCFLLGYAAFWIEKLERQIRELLERCKKTLSEIKGPGQSLGPPPPALVSSNPIQWTGKKDTPLLWETCVFKLAWF